MKSIAKIAAVLLFVSSPVILQRYAVLEHISSPHSTDDGTPKKKKKKVVLSGSKQGFCCMLKWLIDNLNLNRKSTVDGF